METAVERACFITAPPSGTPEVVEEVVAEVEAAVEAVVEVVEGWGQILPCPDPGTGCFPLAAVLWPQDLGVTESPGTTPALGLLLPIPPPASGC